MNTEMTRWPENDTDLLRGAAQGILAVIHRDERSMTLGCSCGQVAQSVTPYVFDEDGHPDERVLWSVVEILEHVIDRGPRHAMVTLIPDSRDARQAVQR